MSGTKDPKYNWSSYLAHASARVAASFHYLEKSNAAVGACGGAARTTAILVSKTLSVPALNNSLLSEIEGDLPRFITRHFNKDCIIPGDDRSLQELVLAGSYHFSTVARYRPVDSRLATGRLGDLQEGTQREVFRSRTGLYNAKIDGVSLSNTNIRGFDHPIAIEYSVNDYCSCASIGDFSCNRSSALISKGNEDLNYYVVYDLAKLRDAIHSILLEEKRTSHLGLLIRRVEYGEKDRVWDIEGKFEHQEDRDHLSIWLSTIFVKAPQYCHEEEIRLILCDLNRAGTLEKGTAPISWLDKRISNAIVDHGPL